MKNQGVIDKISYYSFLVTIFLLPFFFLPAFQFSLGVSKGFLFSIGILLSLFFWLLARIIEGKISVPKSGILLSSLVLAAVYLLASLLSPAKTISLWGQGFEVDTFVSILTFVLAMFLASVFFSAEKKRIFDLQILLVLSFALLSVFWILDMIFGFSASWPAFFGNSGSGNLFGSFNDLAIFAGLVAIISLIALESLLLTKYSRLTAGLVLLLSLFTAAAIGFQAVWLAIGVLALIFFIYRMSNVSAGRPIISLLVFLISVFFFSINSNFLANYLDIKNVDVRPSVSSTLTVINGALKENPILGIGPNRFSAAWSMHKPTAINQTIFWDANFNFGFGLIPSLLATTGILGILSWLLLAVFILLSILKAAANAIKIKNTALNYLLLSSAAAAAYLLIFNFVYVPSLAPLALFFVLIGVLVGSQALAKLIKTPIFSFLNDPRLSFFSILLIIAVMVLTGFLGYKSVKKFTSIVFYERAVTAETLDRAEEKIIKALSLNKSDLYFRSLSDVYLLKMNNLLQEGQLGEADKKILQDIISRAEASAELGVEFDKTNYQNWLSLGAVYENVLPLSVEGAYEAAGKALFEGGRLAPNNPVVDLRLGLLEAAGDNFDGAKKYFEQALAKKPDYAEASRYIQYIEGLGKDNNGQENTTINQ